jgi:hypothetical protein
MDDGLIHIGGLRQDFAQKPGDERNRDRCFGIGFLFGGIEPQTELFVLGLPAGPARGDRRVVEFLIAQRFGEEAKRQ